MIINMHLILYKHYKQTTNTILRYLVEGDFSLEQFNKYLHCLRDLPKMRYDLS